MSNAVNRGKEIEYSHPVPAPVSIRLELPNPMIAANQLCNAAHGGSRCSKKIQSIERVRWRWRCNGAPLDPEGAHNVIALLLGHVDLQPSWRF